MTEMPLLEAVRTRDAAGAQMAQRPVSKLVAAAGSDHARTAAYIRQAGGEEMARRASDGMGGSPSALEVARLPLVSHLEQHLDQIERSMPAVEQLP